MAAELVTTGTGIKYQKGGKVYLFRFSTFPRNLPMEQTEETLSIYCQTEILGLLSKWKAPHV